LQEMGIVFDCGVELERQDEEDLENDAGLARAITAGRNAANAVGGHGVCERFPHPAAFSFVALRAPDGGPRSPSGRGSRAESARGEGIAKPTREIAKFKQFNMAYFTRERGPAGIVLNEPEVRREGARCFKCGTCTMCGNCELFCPDNSIVLDAGGTHYRVEYEYCKGCMVCVQECPRGAIHSRRAEE
ncbi:MAG: 4Fe-4S binding protein, partial [Acidobacteria bacterium]|nr:4Fe-4S binding protein [Acidobacteriota bacterium]